MNNDSPAQVVFAQQQRLLKMADSGAAIEETLGSLIRSVEEQSNGMIGSVLLLEDDGQHFQIGIGPSLPSAYNAAFQSLAIGEGVGSCGTAAYRGETVIVRDIASDVLWISYRDLALQYGLRACWSTPIESHGKVVGTFAMYYRESRTPDELDLQLIESASQVAAAAIERTGCRNQSRSAGGQKRHRARRKTVLVVEDDDALREVVAIFLDASSYAVRVASNGRDAIDIFQKHSNDIDLLLTDVEMPGMTGIELARHLVKISSHLKVLYMSGNTEVLIRGRDERLLRKPFGRSELIDRIRALFGEDL